MNQAITTIIKKYALRALQRALWRVVIWLLARSLHHLKKWRANHYKAKEL